MPPSRQDLTVPALSSGQASITPCRVRGFRLRCTRSRPSRQRKRKRNEQINLPRSELNLNLVLNGVFIHLTFDLMC
jgi:hypothetical protein